MNGVTAVMESQDMPSSLVIIAKMVALHMLLPLLPCKTDELSTIPGEDNTRVQDGLFRVSEV